jgi:hypothetical protein
VFAHKARADQIVLFHHDPYHSDGDLEELLKEARSHGEVDAPVVLAYEGMTIDLDRDGVRFRV